MTKLEEEMREALISEGSKPIDEQNLPKRVAEVANKYIDMALQNYCARLKERCLSDTCVQPVDLALCKAYTKEWINSRIGLK